MSLIRRDRRGRALAAFVAAGAFLIAAGRGLAGIETQRWGYTTDDFEARRTRPLRVAILQPHADFIKEKMIINDQMVAESMSLENEAAGAIKSVLEDLPECDAAHLSVCEARMLASVLDFSDSSAGQARRKAFHRQLCTLGFVEGCQAITEDADARRRLAAACDAHDADACAASPDRKPISPRELCAANDYEACGALGCRGEAQAADLAAGHGIDLHNDCARLIREHEPRVSP